MRAIWSTKWTSSRIVFLTAAFQAQRLNCELQSFLSRACVRELLILLLACGHLMKYLFLFVYTRGQRGGLTWHYTRTKAIYVALEIQTLTICHCCCCKIQFSAETTTTLKGFMIRLQYSNETDNKNKPLASVCNQKAWMFAHVKTLTWAHCIHVCLVTPMHFLETLQASCSWWFWVQT